MKLQRREVLKALTSLSVAALWTPFRPAHAKPLDGMHLIARDGSARLRADAQPSTRIWGYNGQAPGPILRVTQGHELRVRLVNKLKQPTSLHWHGIRIVNAMDGVPHLTQKAVEPGGSFDYRFICPDAGTFWYHPHIMSSEQVARGLHGVLVVEEPDPPRVDQDRVFVIDDWRLMDDGQIHAASFGSIGERAHGGRYGNTFTLNGSTNHVVAVKAGERLRLRLCNVSNANIFGLKIDDHAARVIAVDGQPVTPFEAREGFIALASGQRSDVILDMTGKPGTRSAVRLYTYDEEHVIGHIAYHPKELRREKLLSSSIALPANPLDTKLELSNAETHSLIMDGGAMGGMTGAWVEGKWLGMREMVNRYGFVWSFNGVAGMPKDPLFKVARGRTVKLRMVNRTAWPHAMHLHGHHFKQVARRPEGPSEAHWRDTILISPNEEFVMAWVADNPGKWMLHCHMLEHQEGGMATWFEVI